MPKRNSGFRPEREPFADNDALQLQHSHITGPFTFLNPTNAHYKHSGTSPSDALKVANKAKEDGSEQSLKKPHLSDVSFLWRSRDNRKGRHALVVHDTGTDQTTGVSAPANTSKASEIGRNVLRMFTYFPYWDISWIIAVLFTIGSVVWTINAFFSWLPYVDPSTEFPTEVLYGGGITAFLGAVIFFETGSILLLFEAINENRTGCFGWEVAHLFEEDKMKASEMVLRPSKSHCAHHHQNKSNLVGRHSSSTNEKARPTQEEKQWQWWPSRHDLATHYFHELGFLAGLAQFLGASVFGIAGFTALPGIQDHLSQPALNGAFWAPQVAGACGFVVSGSLYMLETQKKWWLPAPKILGWWIGAFNLIGAFGFLLCGAFGPASANSGMAYQSALCTFWGSWAFLLGSLLQLYESLQKFPVERG